jgi:hypothetical protein
MVEEKIVQKQNEIIRELKSYVINIINVLRIEDINQKNNINEMLVCKLFIIK